jgi:hypothetical protein
MNRNCLARLIPALLVVTALGCDESSGALPTAALSPQSSTAAPPKSGCATAPAPTYQILYANQPSLAGSVKSAKSDTPSTIEFVNATCETLSVYWLDFNGASVLYATLPPGSVNVQPTYVTHPWLVVGSVSGPIAVYFPLEDAAGSPGTAYVAGSNLRKPILPPGGGRPLYIPCRASSCGPTSGGVRG